MFFVYSYLCVVCPCFIVGGSRIWARNQGPTQNWDKIADPNTCPRRASMRQVAMSCGFGAVRAKCVEMLGLAIDELIFTKQLNQWAQGPWAQLLPMGPAFSYLSRGPAPIIFQCVPWFYVFSFGYRDYVLLNTVVRFAAG